MVFLIILLVWFATATATDDVALEDFSQTTNLFTASVYTETLKVEEHENQNFLVSPLSLETILALTQSGAKDQTAEEIRTNLHLPNDNIKIESIFKILLEAVNNTVQSANKIYVKNNFVIKPAFQRVATEVYNAESENIDFSKNAEAAKTMNQWVEQKTQNKIRNLIDAKTLDDRTRTVLINALYFKADWLSPFPGSATSKEKFYTTSTDVRQVDTMHNQHGQYFSYYECSRLDARFLELPFRNVEAASMTFILPNKRDGLSSLENKIERVLAPHNLTSDVVSVALPKFKIASAVDFKEILQKLGVNKAFDAHEADLSGIVGKKGDLIIDKVVQKTFIDVSEEGVEAAAATSVIIPLPPSAILEPTKEFIADHPFIFYIKVKGVIIFVGRVVVPDQ